MQHIDDLFHHTSSASFRLPCCHFTCTSSENQRYTSVSISRFLNFRYFVFRRNLFERFVYMQQQLLMNLCTTHIPLAGYTYTYPHMHRFKRDFNKQSKSAVCVCGCVCVLCFCFMTLTNSSILAIDFYEM